MSEKPSTLTGEDLALAASACSLAIAWWKGEPRKEKRISGYARQEMEQLKLLSTKLQQIGNAAYPNVCYNGDEGFNCDDFGDEPIMKLDPKVLARTTKLGSSRPSSMLITEE